MNPPQTPPSPNAFAAPANQGQSVEGEASLRLSKERLRLLIINANHISGNRYKLSPLWSLVADLFGHGSTEACNICNMAGLNPHQACGIGRMELE